MHVSRLPAEAPASAAPADLFHQVRAGCHDSLNQLMAEHDSLVQVIVRRQFLGPLPFAEALQAGRIGLWHAILGYDPERGLAFSTYAWPSITHQVWRAVAVAQRFDRPLRAFVAIRRGENQPQGAAAWGSCRNEINDT